MNQQKPSNSYRQKNLTIRLQLFAAFAILICASSMAFGAADMTDSRFGSRGETSTQFTLGKDSAQAVVIQADGKIIVGGEAIQNYAGVFIDTNFALVRYNQCKAPVITPI